MVYKVKLDLTYLRIYGCRAYLLRNKISKLEKLTLRAYISYLVGYNLTNIYHIWIPSRDEVVRTRDVIFDKNLFYNPAELDLAHVLRKEPSQIIKLLDISSTIY